MASRTGLLPVVAAKDSRATTTKPTVGPSKFVRRSVVPAAAAAHVRSKSQGPGQTRQQGTLGKDNKIVGAARSRSITAQVKQEAKPRVTGPKADRRSTPGRLTGTKSKGQECSVKQQPKHTPGRLVVTTGKKSPKRSILKKPAATAELSEQKCSEDCDIRHVSFKTKSTTQASLRAKLNSWLEAKGKTPSRCRHLLCFDAEMSAKKKEVKLVDRTITSNLLSGQARVLEKEVRKNLFHTEKTKSPVDEKCDIQKENLEPAGACIEEETSDFAEPNEMEAMEQEEIILPTEKLEAIHINLKTMLDECLALFQGGCPLENILPWLEKMKHHIPQAQRFSPFYITKAKVLMAFPDQVLEVFCDAVRNNAQPADLLAAEMQNLLGLLMMQPTSLLTNTFRTSSYVPLMSPQPRLHSNPQSPCQVSSPMPMYSPLDESVSAATSHESTPARSLCEAGPESGQGSTIRYTISSTTPLLSRTPDAAPLAVVTPVRRSIRLSSRQSTPGIRREVNSVSDLSEAEQSSMLFKVNPAVTGE